MQSGVQAFLHAVSWGVHMPQSLSPLGFAGTPTTAAANVGEGGGLAFTVPEKVKDIQIAIATQSIWRFAVVIPHSPMLFAYPFIFFNNTTLSIY